MKQAVAAYAETSNFTTPLHEQIADVATKVAAQVNADKSLLTGITAVAFMTLEQVGFVRLDAEVMELDLGLGPGEDGRSLERRRLAIPVGQIEDLLA